MEKLIGALIAGIVIGAGSIAAAGRLDDGRPSAVCSYWTGYADYWYGSKAGTGALIRDQGHDRVIARAQEAVALRDAACGG